MKRELVSLHDGIHDKDSLFVSFAYYDEDGKWTGKSKEGEITQSQLYELVEPFLKTKEK